MASIKKLVSKLGRRGPHRVLRGDLAFAGLPGLVYTPASGFNLPAVAFGHDWVTGADRYAGTLEHLASWGIVAAAPDTERGLAPSVLNLGFDLGTTLDIVTGVRLGAGEISVHPGKLGLVGHGFGAGAAIFAAAGLGGSPTPPRAVAALFPSVTKPDATEPAPGLKVPGVVFTAPRDGMDLRSNAVELARAWPDSALHILSKAESTGLAEGRKLAKFVGAGGSDRGTQKSVRALLTGFLLFALTGDKTYQEFADPDGRLPGTDELPLELVPASAEERVVALLRG